MKRYTLLALVAAFVMFPGMARADISNMDMGGDLMLLIYWGENTDDFNDRNGNEVDFLRMEAHLWFQADLADNVMVRISMEVDREMESFESPFDDPAFVPSDLWDDGWTNDLEVFLEEAFISIANIYDTALSLKMGRQFMNFGDNPEADDFNRFWGGSLWFGDGNPNSPMDLSQMGTWEIHPFDAILFEWDFDAAIIDAFYAQAVDDPTEMDADLNVWGINASYIGLEGHQFDGYFAFTDGNWRGVTFGGDRGGKIKHYLVGVRAAGDLLPEELSYKAEFAYNFGDIDDGGLFIPAFGDLNAGDGDFDGFAIEAGLNYHPDMDYSPEIGFIYTYLDGDDKNLPAGGRDDFDGIYFPFEAKTYGQIADSFVFTNVHIFHVNGGVAFNDQWSMDADWYYFLLDEKSGSTTQLSRLPRAWGAANDKDLGFELDLQLNYVFNENVATFLGGGVFWPGDAIEDMSGGADDEAYFIRTGLKVAF